MVSCATMSNLTLLRLLLRLESLFSISMIARVVNHHDYSGYKDNLANDIALVFLDKHVTFTDAIQPVCWDLEGEKEREQLRNGDQGLVPKWGNSEDGIQVSKALKFAELPYVTREECINKSELYRYVTADKLCGGEIKPDAPGTCRGDDGGGWVFYDSNFKKYYLRGIVSLGDPECAGKDYSFFTSLSAHSKFIRDVLYPKN